MKVEFYSETYGEPSKDFKLRREGNLKRYQVYVSDIVENGWKGAQIAAQNTQNIFQTRSSQTQLFSREPTLLSPWLFSSSSSRVGSSLPLALTFFE